MNGRSEFKIKINRQAIAEIADRNAATTYLPHEFIAECADMKDLETANLLLAFQEFLVERRCTPDFEVVLSE